MVPEGQQEGCPTPPPSGPGSLRAPPNARFHKVHFRARLQEGSSPKVHLIQLTALSDNRPPHRKTSRRGAPEGSLQDLSAFRPVGGPLPTQAAIRGPGSRLQARISVEGAFPSTKRASPQECWLGGNNLLLSKHGTRASLLSYNGPMNHLTKWG